MFSGFTHISKHRPLKEGQVPKPRRLPDDVREEVLKQFDESLQIYHFPEVLKQIGHNSSTYPDIEI